MSDITLTQDDIDDLSRGRTINTLAVDGSEHIIGPDKLNNYELDLLEAGGTIILPIDGVECRMIVEGAS